MWIGYEFRVREQQYAIKKAIPDWIGHVIQRPVKTQADRDRLLNKYRDILEREMRDAGKKDFTFDKWIRFFAESHVRWGGTPMRALDILKRTSGFGENWNAEFLSMMDKPTSRKTKNTRRG